MLVLSQLVWTKWWWQCFRFQLCSSRRERDDDRNDNYDNDGGDVGQYEFIPQ